MSIELENSSGISRNCLVLTIRIVRGGWFIRGAFLAVTKLVAYLSNGFILTGLRFAGRSMSPLENRRSFGTLLGLVTNDDAAREWRDATWTSRGKKEKGESVVWSGSEWFRKQPCPPTRVKPREYAGEFDASTHARHEMVVPAETDQRAFRHAHPSPLPSLAIFLLHPRLRFAPANALEAWIGSIDYLLAITDGHVSDFLSDFHYDPTCLRYRREWEWEDRAG